MLKYLALAVIIAVFLIISGCTDDDGVSPPPEPLTLDSLKANPSIVTPDYFVTITCYADDPQGDLLTYDWICSAGSLIVDFEPSQVFWQPPDSTGEYYITVSVSDTGVTITDSVLITVIESVVYQAAATYPGEFMLVEVSGQYAYVIENDGGLMIFDISNPLNPTLVSYFIIEENIIDLELKGDYLYILTAVLWGNIGDKLLIINVTDPANPIQAGELSIDITPFFSSPVLEDNFAYIDDYHNELYIIDISDPENAAVVCEYTENCWGIAVKGNYLYTFTEDGFKTFDISDKSNPSEVHCLQDLMYYQVTGMEVDNNRLYFTIDHLFGGVEAADIYFNGSFHILNISNPAAPFEIYDLGFVLIPGSLQVVNGEDIYMNMMFEWRSFKYYDSVGLYETGKYPASVANGKAVGDYAYLVSYYEGLVVLQIGD